VSDDEARAGTEQSLWEGPEAYDIFRLAQLELLLAVADAEGLPIKSIDRLATYDFLAANPYSMLDGTDVDGDIRDRLTLKLAGFSNEQLTYGSVGNRFANRRSRIQHDLALLVAHGLAQVEDDRYGITDAGRQFADRLSTVYADAFRKAAEIALSRLVRLSDKKLNERVERIMGKSWLLIDFLDDVNEVVTESPNSRNGK
jgi:hypothetical protein